MGNAIVATDPDTLRVSVTIENQSAYAIEEVVQVYGKTDAAEEVLNKKLIAFQRVPLKPKESKSVTLNIPKAHLAVTNQAGQRQVLGDKATLFIDTVSPSKRAEVLSGRRSLVLEVSL